MLTVSPAVSPSVDARILMIQKPRVTAGTFTSVLRASSDKVMMGIRWLELRSTPGRVPDEAGHRDIGILYSFPKLPPTMSG